MRHALNLIDQRLLPVPARPSAAALLALALLVVSSLAGHFGWERLQLAQTLALSGADDPVPSAEAAPDAEYDHALRALQRDEVLRDALAGSTDLPQDSALRLRELLAELPDALWLVEVELSGQRGLRITGGALDSAALAAYAQRLGRLDAWRGTPLQVLNLEPRRDETAAAVPSHQFVLASAGVDEGAAR